MDMRNNKRRKVSIHSRVNFSQSEMSLFLHVQGGGVKTLVTAVGLEGGVNRNDPNFLLI